MFLLGEYRAPRSEHHLFVLLPKHTAGVPSGADPKTPHYQMRTADAVVRADETTLAVYAKLEQAVFYSPIVPAAPNGLKLTRIHAGNGRMALPQEFKLRGFWHFLQSRVEYAFRDELSEKQLSRIAEAIAKDPQRARESESLRVHQETRVLLDATAKPPDDAIE